MIVYSVNVYYPFAYYVNQFEFIDHAKELQANLSLIVALSETLVSAVSY